MNAIHVVSTEDDPVKWLVTQEILEREIRKVRKAKVKHSGEKGKNFPNHMLHQGSGGDAYILEYIPSPSIC